MSEEKPREWWIDTRKSLSEGGWRTWDGVHKSDQHNFFHVIEKSAYDELAAKLEAAEKEIERLKNESIDMLGIAGHEHITRTIAQAEKRILVEQLTRERAINAVLSEALEFYAVKATQYRDEWQTEQLFDDDLGQIAREALTKAKELRDVKGVNKASSSSKLPRIEDWPGFLADEIRATARPSDFDYFNQPMLSPEELEKALSEPSRIEAQLADYKEQLRWSLKKEDQLKAQLFTLQDEHKKLQAKLARERAINAVLSEALIKLINSIEADCMICDEDGSKLGAGWAFVDDIKLARDALAKAKAMRDGE